MNLRALRYFVAIADAGSVTAAAETVAVAQPALSRHLRELERDLNVQLLQRTARGVRLTQAGATLYESAQRILAESVRVRERLSGHDHPGQTVVGLGAPPSLARLLIPGVFERCQRALFGLRLQVREAFAPALIDWVEKGVVDMAIVTNPPAGRAVAMHPLLGEPFALASPPGRYPGPVIAAAQLARIPLLMTTLHRNVAERQMAPLGLSLTVQAEIDSVDVVRELVLQGQGATLMPVSVFKDARDSGHIALSEISGVQLHRQLVMATRIDRYETQAVSVLRDLVLSELDKLTKAGLFAFGGPEPIANRYGKTEI